MAGLKKKRRINMIVTGMVFAISGLGLAYYAMGNSLEYYLSPTEIVEQEPAEGERFRLGGLVLFDSWERGETHTFIITDTLNEVPVSYNGILPDLFEEEQGTIVTGALLDGVFIADEVLAKHDENYMPAEVIDTLKEQGYYVEPES